jgi:hypothetical protein
VTKGDAITPKPESQTFTSCFTERSKYSLLAYTVETILAEKCEAILKRNVVGTRPRDYYDVYMLTHLKKIRPRIFKKALHETFERCGTSTLLKLPYKDRRTLTIETGIQNSGLGLILLTNDKIFPQEIAGEPTAWATYGGMVVITAWWGVWHIISGLTLAYTWRIRGRKSNDEE